MKAILDILARHKSGEPAGIVSVCSAHPDVIEATLRQTQLSGDGFALIEATSNQVNQDGGYTGMTPHDFCHFVYAIADRVGLPHNRIVLGGDHMGPNAWQALSASEAMAKAGAMIAAYIAAGFRKIHLDCSMSCADDPSLLPDAIVAERAAQLCAVAEAAYADVGGDAPVYVIGTEVPVPGGAHEDLATLSVTKPEAVAATIDIHKSVFRTAGLAHVWPRIIAIVVQPGVEFDHDKVVDYVPELAIALKQYIETDPQLVYEAHSTDYQKNTALASLVKDHFAILKVGPGVTFALREALWALASMENDMLGISHASQFKTVVLNVMKADNRHWRSYYNSQGERLDYDLQYSLSDRIRYYWPNATIEAAKATMFANLTANPPPLPLISQYMPSLYEAVRNGQLSVQPHHLVMAYIGRVLDGYQSACLPQRTKNHV